MARCMLVLLVLLCPLRTSAETLSIAPGDSRALVEALQQQVEHGRALHIELARGAVYVFHGPWTAGGDTALPTVTGTVRLHGNGSQLVSYAGGPLGLIEVAETGRLALSQITLSGATGTALRNAGESRLWSVRIEDNFAVDRPAAIDNFGRMQLDDCRIVFNTGQGQGDAAAIRNSGELTIIDGFVSGNRLYASRGSDPAAAALWNEGEARLMRVELSDNEIAQLSPSNRGALINAGEGRMELRHARLLQGDTGALAQGPGSASVVLRDTTVSSLLKD